MGSDLYQITTLAKKDLTVSLKVDVVHPDSMYIPADNSFALMVLREAAKDSDPIAKEIAFEDTLDEGWMTKFATGFIRSVKVAGIANRPPKAAERNSQHAYWENSKKWLTGRLDVTVTHPAWLEHVKKGGNWSSRAFELVSDYDKCDPITPETKSAVSKKGEGEDAAERAFLVAPREAWADFTDVSKFAALSEVPAYSVSGYTVVDKMDGKKLDPKKLKEWIGKAVVYEDTYKSVNHGALVYVEKGLPAVARIEAGMRSGAYPSEVKWIGRAALKAGRRGTRLGYKENIFRDLPSIARVTNKKGRSLSCSVRMPPDGRKLAIQSETDVFHVINRPIVDSDGIGQFKKSPLTTAVIKDLEAVEMEGSSRLDEIEPEIAKDYIASFKFTGGKTTATDLVARLDKGTVTEQRKMLEAPWPEVTLEITVKDEQHIAHLKIDQLLNLHDYPLPKPTKKRPKPKEETPPPPADQRAVLFTAEQIWSAERRGTSVKTRWGKRASKYSRQEKEASFPTKEKAIAAFDKAVAAKLKEKYKAGPTLEEATAIIKKRLGLEMFANDAGDLVVIKAGPPCDKLGDEERRWFKPKDRVTSIRPERGASKESEPMSVEELAIAIASIPAKAGVYLGCSRPASGVGTSVSVNIR